MKHTYCFFAALTLLLLSCKPDADPYAYSYPAVVYSNKSSRSPITIVNAAGEKYELYPGQPKTVDSGLRGRADIVSVEPAYVGWERNQGNIYDIWFVDRKKLEVAIYNYAGVELVFTESGGFLDPPTVLVGAASGGSPGVPPLAVGIVHVYTDKPAFALLGGADWPPIKYRKNGADKLEAAINPPAGWK
jgi:hypothetical protein